MVDWLMHISPRYGWTLLLLVVVFVVYRMGVRMLRSFSDDRKLATPFVILRRVMRWTAVVVAILLGLQTLGVLEAAWATVTAAFTLVAVGFVAMWSVMSHATCAVVMMLTRPFDIGDTLEFPETPNIHGRVVDFSLMFTTLRSETGDLIQIPNNAFFQRIVKRQRGHIDITLEEQLERDEPLEWSDE